MARRDQEFDPHPVTGQPQTDPRPDGVPDNTQAQVEFHKATEEAWAEESTWPVYRIFIEGDEVDYVARPGVNLDDDGNPQPWRDIARATVECHARSEEHAKMLALRDNPTFHTVTSVEIISE